MDEDCKKLQHQLAGDMAEMLHGCPDPVSAMLEVESVEVGWNFKKEPGVLHFRTNKGNFRVEVQVTKEA